MLFEIFTDRGRRLFYTKDKECFPTKEQIASMLNNDYKIKLDGKTLTKKAINKLIEEEKI